MLQKKYYLLVSALIATILSGIISVTPIGSFNQGQVSALYPTLFTPAAFTFSIWSLVYLSWFALGVWVALGKIKVSKANTLLLGSAQILSSLWLIPSQFVYITTSFMVILGVLYLLSINFFQSRKEDIAFRAVVDLFFGWIIIASIANLHQTLVFNKIYIFPEFLTVTSIIIGVFIVLYLIKKYNAFVPSLVALWALIGIIAAQDTAIIQQVSWLSIFTIILTLGFSYKHIGINLVKKISGKK